MKITVFGAGKSGLAAAKKLGKEIVFLTEEKKYLDPKTLRSLKKLKIPFELGGHTKKALEGTDLIVVSPGIPLDIPILEEAKRKKIPIMGEVELAYTFIKTPIIAVTGTNGKTTTAVLIGRLLKDYGYRTAVAGNIGYPLTAVNSSKLDYVIAEISSYQLETVQNFKPWISIILNITQDHLSRHKTMKEYARTKAAIFRNQGKKEHLIYNIDDTRVKSIARSARCRKTAFSRKIPLKNGVFVKDGSIFYNNKMICSTDEIRIKGGHNIENSLAAVSAALLCKVSPGFIRNTLMKFKGVEHRIEFSRKIRGISFYNDSKGTNPDSTIVAIKTLYPDHGIVLILGGRDKRTDLTQMCAAIKEHVKDVVLIGEAKERLRKNLEKTGFKRIHEALSFKEAVKRSYKLAAPGDAVLLSPACASFDMFSNFEERGKVFKKIVANI
ncbi:MAG: UDP-N-acetylmuramoyl-L-alanine--D-glutamate ligase [bacterium]